MIPSIAGGTAGVEDDDDFGDFVFSSPSPFSFHAPSLRASVTAVDEDWGDFHASPLRSSGFQTHSSFSYPDPFDPLSVDPSSPGSSQPSGKAWEKPKGAIPLSIFGEEDAEEIKQLESPGVFENGFASNFFSSQSSMRPAPTGRLNDLLESLYDQSGSGKEQEDDFDTGSWEFKDAFSAYSAGPKLMDEGDDAIFGLKMSASENENGRSKIDANRLENGWKGMEQFETNNQERIPGDNFAIQERLTDRPLGHNHSATEKFHHEILPSFGNGDLSIGINGFKLECPEYTIRNGSTEKIQADQVEVLHPPEKKEVKEGTDNQWDIDGLNIFTYVNGKKNSNGSPEDHIEHSKGIGNMDDSPVALAGIIHNLYENADRSNVTLPSEIPINNVQGIDQNDNSHAHVNGDIDIDQSDWEFQNAPEIAEAGNVASHDSEKILSSESTSYTFVELYCRLKEESVRLVVHHLVVLKVPALPGATPEVKKINEEIQEAYGNMQEMMTSVDAGTSKKIAGHIDPLLNVIGSSDFKAVENEYSLSERLLAAEKDLNAAVELFVHSSSVLHILRLASKEQQLFYIKAWSKLALACAQELKLGAKIWTEAIDGNISKQLLSKGNKYFIALAEVFRVSKIMKATVRFYMPWLLSNLEDSTEILTWLEKGNQTWINSGLEETLKTISCDAELDESGLAKPLLESIKLIDKIIGPAYLDPIFHHKHGVCKFYLLPLDKLPELKTVVWNGECYITKLANFWANRISPDPPQLPPITPS